MTADEMKLKIQSSMYSSVAHGLLSFACLKSDDEVILKKLIIDDNLRNDIIELFDAAVVLEFLVDGIGLDSIENIDDNRRMLYYIEPESTYHPFACLDNYSGVMDQYEEKDQNSLLGFAFRVNSNDKAIWLYQHVYQSRLIKRSKSLYAMLSGNHTYVPLAHDVLKVEFRVDILIIDGIIITSNVGLLQKYFGFEKYIRTEATKTIEIIRNLDIVSDINKLLCFENKDALTNAKKLLKAKSSPVLKLSKDVLIDKIKQHRRYRDKFRFEEGRIVINSLKDVNELLKMLNDNILRSELTDQEYDSQSKHILESIAKS